METSNKLESFPWLSASTAHKEKKTPCLSFYRQYCKKFFDVSFAILLLPIILPALATLALLIKLDSPGPIIYRSRRIGKGGVPFDCLKLRTMHINADEKLEFILKQEPKLQKEYQTFRKLKQDPRVTRIGKILRTLSLDELPQLFNIIKGEMSFIGPRPAFQKEVTTYYGKHQQAYKSVLPGITGLWQISGRNNVTFEKRVLLDSFYSNNLNPLLDIKIMLKTIPIVLLRKGAY